MGFYLKLAAAWGSAHHVAPADGHLAGKGIEPDVDAEARSGRDGLARRPSSGTEASLQ
ncbi:MAG: hypothetical protein VYC68_02780 [Candidatus Thermoplasmatota archaeon]|nr:hypothetical protein [Candidatus Thermoplasmatota archaeon]